MQAFMISGEVRRSDIINGLNKTTVAISATALAKKYGVSRQVIVQDIALLRANGYDIISTNRGYLIATAEQKPQRVFKVYHNGDQAREEMQTIVDLGGVIDDIFISHRVYGTVRGELNIRSRRDIDHFMQELSNSASRPLSDATNGYHYHTVTADSQETLDMIFDALKEKGFLADLTDFEPVNFYMQ